MSPHKPFLFHNIKRISVSRLSAVVALGVSMASTVAVADQGKRSRKIVVVPGMPACTDARTVPAIVTDLKRVGQVRVLDLFQGREEARCLTAHLARISQRIAALGRNTGDSVDVVGYSYGAHVLGRLLEMKGDPAKQAVYARRVYNFRRRERGAGRLPADFPTPGKALELVEDALARIGRVALVAPVLDFEAVTRRLLGLEADERRWKKRLSRWKKRGQSWIVDGRLEHTRWPFWYDLKAYGEPLNPASFARDLPMWVALAKADRAVGYSDQLHEAFKRGPGRVVVAYPDADHDFGSPDQRPGHRGPATQGKVPQMVHDLAEFLLAERSLGEPQLTGTIGL